jgi:hypothetical protein
MRAVAPARTRTQVDSPSSEQAAQALWPRVVEAVRRDNRIGRHEDNPDGVQESFWTWKLADKDVPHVVRVGEGGR